MKRTYIISVLALLVAYVVWYSMPYMWFYWYEGKVLETLRLNGHDSAIQISALVYNFFLGAYGIICIGLINFQKWARKGLLLWVLINFTLQTFSGLLIQIGFESLLGSLVNFGNGALLVTVYFTTISESFDSSSKESYYTDKNKKISDLTRLSIVSWIAIGIFMVPIDISVAAMFFPNKFHYLSEGYLYSNLFFYAGIIHLIISFMLSRPTRNTYHTQSNAGGRSDPFVGLDRYELADQGHGIDNEKSRRNLWEALYFGIPGAVLFSASLFLGSQ